MIKKEIKIYVPLNGNEDEYEKHFGKITSVIKELEELSGSIRIRFQGEEIAPLNIQYLKKTSRIGKRLFSQHQSYKYIKHYIFFKAQIKISHAEEFEAKQSLYISFEYFVKSYVRHILIYFNLAKPGFFHTSEGVSILSEVLEAKTEKIESFDPVLSLIGESLYLLHELKWPPIKELPLKTVYDWLKNHWTAFETVPTNRIERSLNAFSYLFHTSFRDESANDLFYSVLGLESLFVTGHDNVKKQVDTKTQILFGMRTNFKKKFNELYDFRSRYIHGQLNITNKYFVDDKDEIVFGHLNPLYENSCFAILMLLTSIQKHIELNKTDLEFDFVLKM